MKLTDEQKFDLYVKVYCASLNGLRSHAGEIPYDSNRGVAHNDAVESYRRIVSDWEGTPHFTVQYPPESQ